MASKHTQVSHNANQKNDQDFFPVSNTMSTIEVLEFPDDNLLSITKNNVQTIDAAVPSTSKLKKEQSTKPTFTVKAVRCEKGKVSKPGVAKLSKLKMQNTINKVVKHMGKKASDEKAMDVNDSTDSEDHTETAGVADAKIQAMERSMACMSDQIAKLSQLVTSFINKPQQQTSEQNRGTGTEVTFEVDRNIQQNIC